MSNESVEHPVFKTGNRYFGTGRYEVYPDLNQARKRRLMDGGSPEVVRMRRRAGTFPPHWETGLCAYYVPLPGRKPAVDGAPGGR